MSRLPRDLGGGPLNINPYFLPKTGQVPVVGDSNIVLPGSVLGDGAILGALSLLRALIPAWEIWGGVPARHLRDRKRDLLALEKKQVDQSLP